MAGISGLTLNNYFGTSTSGISTLMSSLGSDSSIASISSDYNSIKNGSYYKLMKSYYSNASGSSSSSSSISSLSNLTSTNAQTKTSELNKVKSYANELSDSAKILKSTSSDSLFATGSRDDIFNAVSNLVDNYNSLMEKASDSSVNSIVSSASTLDNVTSTMSNSLSKIGITYDKKDGTLSISEDTFNKADLADIKAVFNGSSSLSQTIDTYATSIYNTATVQQSLLSSGMYASTGSYTYSSGSLYDSYF